MDFLPKKGSFPPKLILAPMAGVSDLPFRNAVFRCGGTSFMVCEMIASQSLIRAIPKTLKKACQGPGFTGIQLAGNEPEIMAHAALMAQDNGACFIDINMGCPAKKIAINSYAGSALMRDLPLARQIFKAIKKAVSIPVSVKMRKGWDHTSENAQELLEIAAQEGLAFGTIHGRTRQDFFSGKADWDFIIDLQKKMDFPLIANGDIHSLESVAVLAPTSVGLMVGRGAYGQPWIFQQMATFLKDQTRLPPPSFAKQKEIILEHYEDILTHYGIEKGLAIARKHLGWYSKGLPQASLFRSQVFQATNPSFVRTIIQNIYDDL